MPKPNFVTAPALGKGEWGERRPAGYFVTCVGCGAEAWVRTATLDYTCGLCGAVTPKMRERSPAGRGRKRHGVYGLLTDEERSGYDDGSNLTNSQWSEMHTLWLEALRAGLPTIEMSDREMRVRFDIERDVPPWLAPWSLPKNERFPIRRIRLVVRSADGRHTFAERIEPYVADRKTVQAMFLSLKSVLARLP